ncbi:MAG: methyltransferase domain-containing protein [Rhodospirillaceae bacterium]|nr:methyltransferase domain-containing protein [Rhodospirillaceae bacterium]MDD9924487.1 methyltransferase domain-containing protein [Rhodospirillaceae bacterium]
MSSYEDYGRVSRSYDRTRRPVGLPLVREGLMRCGTPPDSLNLVDAGCGTGAYTEALSGDIPNIIALDFSAGMLDAARTKCRDLPTRFLRASIQAVPLEDGAADGILNNLVLHHLPNDGGFAAQRQAFSEFARILRPGGALVIGVCTREQLRDGFWFTRLIPNAIDACCAVTAPLVRQVAMLEDAGFSVEKPAVPWDDILQGDAYFDRLGPLDAAWRDGDSVWSLAPPEELEAAITRVRTMEEAGSLAAWVSEHEAQRLNTGQITYLRAIRR